MPKGLLEPDSLLRQDKEYPTLASIGPRAAKPCHLLLLNRKQAQVGEGDLAPGHTARKGRPGPTRCSPVPGELSRGHSPGAPAQRGCVHQPLSSVSSLPPTGDPLRMNPQWLPAVDGIAQIPAWRPLALVICPFTPPEPHCSPAITSCDSQCLKPLLTGLS